jgi:hypothetical protein
MSERARDGSQRAVARDVKGGIDGGTADARRGADARAIGNDAVEGAMRSRGSDSQGMDGLEESLERTVRVSGTSTMETVDAVSDERDERGAGDESDEREASRARKVEGLGIRMSSSSVGDARDGQETVSGGEKADADERIEAADGDARADKRRGDASAVPSVPPLPMMPPPPLPTSLMETMSQQQRQQQQYVMSMQQQSAAAMTIPREPAMTMSAVWTNDDPSRTLYLVLADPMMSDQLLWQMLSQFGEVRALSSEMRRSLNAVFAAYYDVRSAENAKRTLQVTSHVFHMVAYSATCEWIPGMENQGRFLAFNVGANDDVEREAELRSTLETFGDLKRLTVPKGHENHRFVEYFDVRHAEKAVMELQRVGFRGSPLHVDFQCGHPQQMQTQSFSAQSPPAVMQYMGAQMMPNMYWPYAHSMAPGVSMGAMQGYGYQGWPTEQQQFGYAMMQGSGAGYGASHRSPRTSGEYTRSPRSSENMGRSRSSGNSAVDGGARVNPEEFIFSMEEANDEGTSEHPETHGRTTLMIRNIPNKYNQAMMLDLLNRSYVGQYDFFYLPIDFKNKCNLGYAFVNFKCAKQTAAFYEEFHKQKWEEFNSRKVCEVTYARVQGKDAMVEHFKNSRFPCENEEYLPLVFDTDGNKTSCHTLGHTSLKP